MSPDASDTFTRAVGNTVEQLLSHGLTPLNNPHDLKGNEYPIAFYYNIRIHGEHIHGGYHFARIDPEGRWSEKPGKMKKIIRSHSSDPTEQNDPDIKPDFKIPICFFGVTAP